jgi:hypothetical protein
LVPSRIARPPPPAPLEALSEMICGPAIITKASGRSCAKLTRYASIAVGPATIQITASPLRGFGTSL